MQTEYDIIRRLSKAENDQAIDFLAGWGESYRAMTDVLKAKSFKSFVTVKSTIKDSNIDDFSSSLIHPMMVNGVNTILSELMEKFLEFNQSSIVLFRSILEDSHDSPPLNGRIIPLDFGDDLLFLVSRLESGIDTMEISVLSQVLPTIFVLCDFKNALPTNKIKDFIEKNTKICIATVCDAEAILVFQANDIELFRDGDELRPVDKR